jgi:dihydroneopterin aldolase
MQIPSNLIEHVAGRIQKKILQTFDKVSKVEVVVKKKILPLDASLNYVAVEIS